MQENGQSPLAGNVAGTAEPERPHALKGANDVDVSAPALLRREPRAANAPIVTFVIHQAGAKSDGGIESVTQIIERLRTVRAHIVTQLESPATQRWRRAGATVHVWPTTPVGSSLWTAARRGTAAKAQSIVVANLRLTRLIRTTGSKLVHCNDPSALWHSVAGAQFGGARVVLNIRDTKAPDDLSGARKWQLGTRLVDCCVVLSADMADYWTHALDGGVGRPPPIIPIYSAVDPQLLYPHGEDSATARRRLGIPSQTFAVAYVGRFCPKKGQLDFIRYAIPPLLRRVPHARVYFVGDFNPEADSYAETCRREVVSRDLAQSVEFRNFSSSIGAWYKAVNAVALTSKNEGLARCMIESLAIGTPVVSFAVCSAREILEKHNCGFVAPHGDYGTLVSCLDLLSNNPDLANELGRNGAGVAHRLFRPESIVEQYENLYRSMLSD